MSLGSVIVISERSIPVIEEELPMYDAEHNDEAQYIVPQPIHHTLPTAAPYPRSPFTSLLHHPALRNRQPLTSTYTPTRSPMNPDRTWRPQDPSSLPSLSTPVKRRNVARPFGSPVMIPFKPPSTPRPRSPTPDRMSSPPTSPGWTHVSPRAYR